MGRLLPLIAILIELVSSQTAFMYGRSQPEKDYKKHFGKSNRNFKKSLKTIDP
jgi:hypothetical protein